MTSAIRPRRLRWLVAGAVAASAAAGVVAVQEAPAQPSTAICSLNIQLDLRPGLILTNRSGSIISRRPGTLNCIGLINGSPVTGPGTFAVSGQFSGTCLAGTTSGDAHFSIPTANGTATSDAEYDVTWVGVAGLITVTDPVYGQATGPFEFLPVTGNCLNQPLNVIRWFSQQVAFN